jgi:hypothetical protein
MQEGPSCTAGLEDSPLPSTAPTLASPHEDHGTEPSTAATAATTALLHAQAFPGSTDALYEDLWDARESSLEGDSAEDSEDEESIEGGDAEERLGWPPELLLAPKRQRLRWREEVEPELRLSGETPSFDNSDDRLREQGGEGSGRGPGVGGNGLRMGTGSGADWEERGSREGEGPRVPWGAGAAVGEGICS